MCILLRTKRLSPETKEKEGVARDASLTPLNTMQVYHKSPYRRQMVAEIVRTFKGVTSYYVRRSDKSMTGFGWHRDFFERIIRNARELDALRTYILNNPAKWQEDKLHPRSGSNLIEGRIWNIAEMWLNAGRDGVMREGVINQTRTEGLFDS